MTLLCKIFHQAEKTFAIANKDLLRTNILLLRKLIDQIQSPEDLLIDPYFVSKKSFDQMVSNY